MGVVLLALEVRAQTPAPSGNVYGSVRDEQDRPIAEVTVTLEGSAAPRAATTDANGNFHFLNLAPDVYSVTCERAGFSRVRREGIVVALGKDSVLTITLPVAAEEEAVTVSASSLVDSRKTETGATFDRKELDTIPTTRDPWAVLRQVPGVLVENVNVNGGGTGQQSDFVGKGANGTQNVYNLDGVAITDARGGTTPGLYFDFDSFQNIEVATGGSDPSLSAPGVTVNLVTRRGTNELKGSARALYFFPSAVGSVDQTTSQGVWDYGAEAGGPLWKDHAWIWGAGAHNSIPGDTALSPDSPPFRPITTLTQWNAKLNVQPAKTNELVFFYLHSDKNLDGAFAGGQYTPDSSWNQTTPVAAYRVGDSQTFSSKVVADLYGAYVDSYLQLFPRGGLNVQADYLQPGAWFNSIPYFDAREVQHQAGGTVSGFFDTGKLSHELKFGFGYRHVVVNSMTVWPDGQIFGNEVLGLAGITRASNPKFEMNYYDSFLGDTIATGNLTVSVGLRFDYEQSRNLPSSVPANPLFPELLPPVHYAGDSGYPITWRELQPRVGATYSVGSDKKTLLRASYSRFADQLGGDIYFINAFPGAVYLYYGWNDANGDRKVQPNEVDTSNLQGAINVDPSNPGAATSVNQIASDFKAPVTDEWIIGIDRQISTDLSASFAFTHRYTQDLKFPYFPNISLSFPIIGVSRSDYRYAGNASGTATAGGFSLPFSEPYFDLVSCPAPCAGNVLANRKDYTSRYDGVDLQIVKAFSHGWSLRAGFAYNDWRQQVGQGAIVNPNNLWGGLNANGVMVEPAGKSYLDAGSFINARWQFNVSGMVSLPLGLTAAGNFFGREGFPIAYHVNVITVDARGLEQIPLQIGAVDAYRNPDVYNLDLHLERTFGLGRAISVTPSIDCFNVINSHPVLQRVGLVGVYDARGNPPTFQQEGLFNQPIERLSDRTFRAGLRVGF